MARLGHAFDALIRCPDPSRNIAYPNFATKGSFEVKGYEIWRIF